MKTILSALIAIVTLNSSSVFAEYACGSITYDIRLGFTREIALELDALTNYGKCTPGSCDGLAENAKSDLQEIKKQRSVTKHKISECFDICAQAYSPEYVQSQGLCNFGDVFKDNYNEARSAISTAINSPAYMFFH